MRMPKFVRRSSGQALVETILIVPLLLAIVLNAINFAYFVLMALDITSTARTSGLYSIMGGATPAAIALPLAGSFNCTTPGKTVSDLACQDLTGAVYSPSTNTGLQVCSPSVGILNAGTGTQQSACSVTTSGSVGSFPTAEPDPECSAGSASANPPCTGGAPAFMLNRVDIAYQFTPLIPFMPFNLIVMTSPACTTAGTNVTCTFYRHTVMRVM